MSVIEQAPQYTLTCQDDGRQEKFQLTVQLPGVESAAELDVVVRPTLVSIRVPGRFKLELPIDPPVHEKPDRLCFVKKKSQLKAVLVVDEAAQRQAIAAAAIAAAAATGPPGISATAAPRPAARTQRPPSDPPRAAVPSAAAATATGATAAAAAGSSSALGPGQRAVVSGPASTSPFASAPAPAAGAGAGSGAAAGGGAAAASDSASGAAAAASGGGGGGKAAMASHARPVHDSFYEGALPGFGGKTRGGKSGLGAGAGGGVGQGAGQPRQPPATLVEHAAKEGGAAAPVLTTGTKGTSGNGSSSSCTTNGKHADGFGKQPPAQQSKTPQAQPPKQQKPEQRQSTSSPNGLASGNGLPTSTTTASNPSGNNSAAASAPAAPAAPAAPTEQLYATAKHRANREAALQWLERALSAARQGDTARADLLLDRAVGLCPDEGELLATEYNTRCDPDHRLKRRQQQDDKQPQQQNDKQQQQQNDKQKQNDKQQQPAPAHGHWRAQGQSVPNGGPAGAAGGGASSSAGASGQQSADTARAGPAPAAPEPAKPAKPSKPQQEHKSQPRQAAAGGATNEAASEAPSSAGGRPSQPYAFIKPEPERFSSNPTSPRPGSSASAKPAAGSGTGPSGQKAAEGAAGEGGARVPPGGATRGSKAGAAGGGAGGKPAAAGTGAGATKAEEQRPGQQQGPGQQKPGQAGTGRSGPQGGSAGFKPEPRARPPPRHRSGGGGGDADAQPGDAAGSGSGGDDGGGAGGGGQAGGERRWDWWFVMTMAAVKRTLEPHAAPGWVGLVIAGLAMAVYGILMIPHFTLSFLAATLHFLYEVAGYPDEARGLERYCQKYARWMVGCASITGVPLAAFLYLASGGIRLLLRWMWILVLGPPLWLAALQSAVLFWGISFKRRPMLSCLAPLPVLCCLADAVVWRLAATLIFIGAHAVAPGRIRAAVFASAVVFSCRSLVWYQALPALLLEFIGWLMMSAAATGDSSGGRGGGRDRGPRSRAGKGAADDSGDEAGSGYGQGGEGGGTPEVPRGGRLAPEHVKGATGDIARVLAARDYFSVLGLPAEPAEAQALSDEAVKAAWRRTQLRVHPDKAGDAAGAAEASQRVNMAYTLLQTAKGREGLLNEMRGRTAPPAAVPTDNGGRPVDGFDMECWSCHLLHTAKILTTDVSRARYCKECRTHHPAADNDMWVWEDPAAFLFPERKMLMCMKGVVLDVTEMAQCCGLFHKDGMRLPANTHTAQFKIGPQSSKGTNTGPGHFRGRGEKGSGTKSRKSKRR